MLNKNEDIKVLQREEIRLTTVKYNNLVFQLLPRLLIGTQVLIASGERATNLTDAAAGDVDTGLPATDAAE